MHLSTVLKGHVGSPVIEEGDRVPEASAIGEDGASVPVVQERAREATNQFGNLREVDSHVCSLIRSVSPMYRHSPEGH